MLVVGNAAMIHSFPWNRANENARQICSNFGGRRQPAAGWPSHLYVNHGYINITTSRTWLIIQHFIIYLHQSFNSFTTLTVIFFSSLSAVSWKLGIKDSDLSTAFPIHRNNELISPDRGYHCGWKHHPPSSRPLRDSSYKRGQTPNAHKLHQCVVFSGHDRVTRIFTIFVLFRKLQLTLRVGEKMGIFTTGKLYSSNNFVSIKYHSV